ncbi:MAG: hypothetical protein OZ929_01780 [Bryobacterales bacterium]|nr:hypothetical protein [Bryobacterales bacterium]
MQELGNAINESLSDSERIAAAIGQIKRSGYDVFLVLEATIGFNKRDEDAGDDEDQSFTEAQMQIEEAEVEEPPARRRRRYSSTGRVKWTSQDHKFLKALKISTQDDPR